MKDRRPILIPWAVRRAIEVVVAVGTALACSYLILQIRW
jgi:hypothetical protein